MAEEFDEAALDYHRYPKPGKLEIIATKNMVNQRDLALAYSPGVAAACREIERDAKEARHLTARSNLVAVITNGTAVLGLGPIGPLASKPVMEGKAVLFKKFANVDVFDLELDTTDVDRFCDAVSLMEPTFGGINLEDIKAPECFEIEKRLRERMKIPVFHDDQHGTAIVVAAAIRNGLRLAEKDIADMKLVCSGAGAAALACLNLLVSMGLRKENVTVLDIEGVVYEGRTVLMDPYKAVYARDTEARTLEEAIVGADIFLGLSAPRVLKPEFLKAMAPNPFIMALANPEPEILPELAREVRPDAIIATGRSDYPNQVNNVLCFPFLFRGALDVGATQINEEMKIACVEALSDLAMKEASDVVAAAYGGTPFKFGPEYLIPKPFDPRLMTELPPRIAKAAMDSGVATQPIEDFHTYRRKLREFVVRSGLVMKPVFERAQQHKQRVVIAEGESTRVLNALQVLVDDGICHPVLLGRPEFIEKRIRERVAGHGSAGKAVYRANTTSHEAAYNQLLLESGYVPVHSFVEMGFDPDVPLPEKKMPEGFALKPAGVEDYRAIWEANEEAFEEEWGHRRATDEDYIVFLGNIVGNPGFDPSLWQVAWRDEAIAGVALCEITPRGVGEISELSVRQQWRNHGLGRALLISALHALRLRGVEPIRIFTDVDNARRLYESVGFRALTDYIRYQKPVQ